MGSEMCIRDSYIPSDLLVEFIISISLNGQYKLLINYQHRLSVATAATQGILVSFLIRQLAASLDAIWSNAIIDCGHLGTSCGQLVVVVACNCVSSLSLLVCKAGV